MKYVLLTDNDNGTALIQCMTQAEAEQVASAAVWSDGGVSAWLVPDRAFVDCDRIEEMLRDNHNCHSLNHVGLHKVKVAVVEQ